MTDPHGFESQENIFVSRNRLLADSLLEQLKVTSFGRSSRTVRLRVDFEADFLDLFEVRGWTRQKVQPGQLQPPLVGRNSVAFGYRGADGVARTTTIRFSPAPEDLSPTAASLLFGGLGYGYATTSFRATGLIEPDTWIGGDLLELVATAETLLVHSTGRTPRYVYQTGGSQGGLGTVQAVERYPNVFSGGLAGCGPIGDYGKQIAYVADFRAVFDYFFAGVIPGWPVWTQDLSANDPGYVDPSSWGTAEQTAGAALDDPGNAGRIRQVLDVTHASIDPGDPASIKATTLDVLWYSFRGTNDAIVKLGGTPFGNLDRVYRGSLDDTGLNAGVARFQFTADPAKLAKLQTAASGRW